MIENMPIEMPSSDKKVRNLFSTSALSADAKLSKNSFINSIVQR